MGTWLAQLDAVLDDVSLAAVAFYALAALLVLELGSRRRWS
jgi:hypothetical protein